jgi:hypothetical protein
MRRVSKNRTRVKPGSHGRKTIMGNWVFSPHMFSTCQDTYVGFPLVGELLPRRLMLDVSHVSGYACGFYPLEVGDCHVD